jgi:hypothetical protein
MLKFNFKVSSKLLGHSLLLKINGAEHYFIKDINEVRSFVGYFDGTKDAPNAFYIDIYYQNGQIEKLIYSSLKKARKIMKQLVNKLKTN